KQPFTNKRWLHEKINYYIYKKVIYVDELILFYYCTWFIYIVVYFFMQPSFISKGLLMFILIYICLSPYFIMIGSLYVSLSFCLLLISVSVLFGLSYINMDVLFVTFICMISYVVLLLWEKLAPVLVFIPSQLWIAIIIVFIVRFLLRSFTNQVIVTVIGLSWGQLMYELILIDYGLETLIGNYEYMNYLDATIICLFITEKVVQLFKKVIYGRKIQMYINN